MKTRLALITAGIVAGAALIFGANTYHDMTPPAPTVAVHAGQDTYHDM